jgi:ribosomal protein S18 acetylase RimI-like enzyme
MLTDKSTQIREGIKPGDIGAIVQLHGTLYAREYGLDHTFEGYVAAGIGEFAVKYNEQNDYLAVAEQGGQIYGSIAIVGHDDMAQLRWFIVHPELRGQGVGTQLLDGAIRYCRQRPFKSVLLWTISELTTAARLYKAAGFRLTEQKTHEIWGAIHTEERYDLDL